jgi:hypothetical protein
MNALGSTVRGRSRRRDRRTGVAGLLASLAPALRRADTGLLRAMFEEGTRRLVGATRVQLCDAAGARQSRSPDVVALDVPTAEPARPIVLEATGQTSRRFDEWDLQLLAMASQLAALVVELERARAARGAVAPVTMRDGAAPIIGSTPGMRALRTSI